MNSRVTKSHAASAFRPDIEGLRGVAVLLVVLFHSRVPGFGGGYIGVDIFFAVSGYLITGLIVREIDKSAAFSFRNFYARRGRRLLPASGLMVFGVLLAGVFLYSPLELSRYAIWGTYTSLYISNLMFMRETGNYFAGVVTANPFLHTWSLAVEEQFYLLWPALIALVYLRSKSRQRLALALLVVSVVSLAASVWVTHVRQPWAFFSLPTRAWEFGTGGLACLLRRESLSGKDTGIKLLGWAGFATLLFSGHFYSRVENIFPGWLAAIPVAGTLAILVEGATETTSILQRILASPLMQWLGRLSYSWYLWHWPFLIYAQACLPGLSWKGRVAVSVLSLITAQITYLLFENPIRFYPRLVASPALSLSLAVLVPAIGATAALAAVHKASQDLAEATQQQILAAAVIGRWHDCLVPVQASGVKECVFADKTSSTTVVLLGDSHAGQWFPAINAVAQEKHWKLVTLLKGNCQIAAQETDSAGRASNPSCQTWRNQVIPHVAELRPFMVVLGESAFGVDNQRMAKKPVTAKEWEADLRSVLARLDAVGTKTLVMADIPYSSFDVPVCLSRKMSAKWGAGDCAIAKESALHLKVRQSEAAAVATDANSRWVNFSDMFCSATSCNTVIDGIVAYRDDNHISEIFARHLQPELQKQIGLLTHP